MKNVKKVLLVTYFGLFITQKSIDASFAKYAKRCAAATSTLIATTITAERIATGTCNPLSDTLHKTLTDCARKEGIKDNLEFQCFIEQPNGTRSNYKFLDTNTGYAISSDPTEDQKNEILQILRAKGLSEDSMGQIQILHTHNAHALIQSLQTSATYRTQDNSGKQISEQQITIPLAYALGLAKIKHEKSIEFYLFYCSENDSIYISSLLLNGDLSKKRDLAHGIFHEVTHRNHTIGHKQCANLFQTLTEYIAPLFQDKDWLYKEEKRAELEALKLVNCKTCIRMRVFNARRNKDAHTIQSEIASGYVSLDQDFVSDFLNQNPHMPKTCTLCKTSSIIIKIKAVRKT